MEQDAIQQLEEGGLEIPCSLIFRGIMNESIEKVKGKLKNAPKECCEAIVQSENSEISTKRQHETIHRPVQS